MNYCNLAILPDDKLMVVFDATCVSFMRPGVNARLTPETGIPVHM
jgi:hypothetical protein